MKTTISLLVLYLLATTFLFSQTTNIQQPTSMNTDGAAPDASAMLDVQSTTQGMLVPRMTMAQRETIASPASGLLVFDTGSNTFWFSDNGFWTELAAAATPEMGANTNALVIPDCDPAGVSSVISLNQPGLVVMGSQFEVCLDITHPRAKDMDISMVSPDGTVIDLSSDNGGDDPDYTGTCFTTGEASPITGGMAPFTGNWVPEEPFSNFIGDTIAGDWALQVVDDKCNNTGQLNSWSIQVLRDGGIPNFISDNDGDTQIQVEESADEDFIHFDAGGSESLLISSGQSIFKTDLEVDGTFESGSAHNASGLRSFVGGGIFSAATGDDSFVGGGGGNISSEAFCFVGGGIGNTASDTSSFVGGGFGNTASGKNSFAGGGDSNTALSLNSFAGGGSGNSASGERSFVGGGESNTASGFYSFVGGGRDNTASATDSFIGGGSDNTISSNDSFIGGGSDNVVSNVFCFAGGGTFNTISGANSFVGGGTSNEASGVWSFIGGGTSNIASGYRSFVGGGSHLLAKSYIEAVFGQYNTDYTPISPLSFESADRLFVIGNGTSTGNRSNAVTVFKNGNANLAGTLTQNSDSRLKENIRPLQGALSNLGQLNGYHYHWKGANRSPDDQIGLIAQEVQAVYPELVSQDEEGILSLNYSGLVPVLVESVKELQQQIESLSTETKEQRVEIENLQSQLSEMDELKQRMAKLEAALLGSEGTASDE